MKSLELEIGCGVGMHPIRRALAHPEISIVAIEKTEERFSKFYRRYVNHRSPTNLTPVHADAIQWVRNHLGKGSLERIWLLYPNPSPKNPKGRWFRMPFFRDLNERLKPGGKLILATNLPHYSQEAKIWGEKWGLRLEEERQIPRLGGARTHFERKYLERGDICFEQVWVKPEKTVPNPT